VIGAATLASRLLGMARDYVQARLFGAGDVMDAFVLATRIPTLLRDLFAEGAMSAAFVPTFTRYLTAAGHRSAWRLGSLVINGLVIVTGTLVVLGILLADPITRAYAAAEFEAIPGQVDLTVWLTRLNMPFLLLIAVAAAFMGMLNAFRHFFVPAMSPAMYNVVFILSAIVFAWVCPLVGWPPITALAIGMLLGGMAQAAVQWPALRREGYRHEWVFDPRDPGLREVLVLMGPGTLGVAAAQVNLFVNTVLATSESGAASALSYAFRLMYVPIGVFGVSVATAALPDLARHAATAAHDDMRRTLSWGLRLMLMLSVPATVGLMVLARPIIELVLESGAFGAAETAMVAGALIMYAPGIVGYSIVKIASPSFYSLRDARTPVFVSLATIALNLILNVWLDRIMGYRGLALGTALAAIFNAGVLLLLLSRRVGGLEGARVLRAFVKIALAAIAMGAAAFWSEAWLRGVWPGGGTLAQVVRVFGPIGVGVAVLALASALLRIEEFTEAVQRVVGRIRA
jgi:putative peptidoglycan lipid II flippase